MRYDREPWRKLYRSEPLEQRAWPMMARGIRDYLIRFAEDDGTLLQGVTGDPLETLERVLNSDVTEREHVRNALEHLFADGYIVSSEGRVRIRNFEAAQETRTPAARRMAAKRARDKSGESSTIPAESTGVTERNEGVTPGRTSSVTPERTCSGKRREEKRREESVRNARAKPPARDPMGYLAAAKNPEVEWAFQAWQSAFGQPDAQLTTQRANALQARFEESPVGAWRSQVSRVLAAGKADPFITDKCRGELLRMFDKRERFELYLSGGPKKRKPSRAKGAVQPDVAGAPNFRPDKSKYEVTL